MVIDTSALIAILKTEPEAMALMQLLSQPQPKHLSTATLLETRIGRCRAGAALEKGATRRP